MMISPEYYYEMNLKGKTKEEISKEIRSLKRETNRLKRLIEEDARSPELMVDPSPLARIDFNREYLAEAIKAYKEAGGEYIPTKAEQKDREFNDDLNSIKKVKFSCAGLFLGIEARTFTIADDTVSAESFSLLMPSKNENDDQEPWEKDDFISELKNLHIGEWQKTYAKRDDSDRYQWELEIEFSNGRRIGRYYGTNACPYNFEDVLDLFNVRPIFDDYDEGDKNDEQNQD